MQLPMFDIAWANGSVRRVEGSTMIKRAFFGLLAALAVFATPANAQNLVFNGSFEQATVNPGGSFLTLGTGSTAINNWEVSAGSIDYIGGYWLRCHFSRHCLMFSFFASQYIRSFLVQGAFLIIASGLIVLQAGRYGGRPAVLLLLALVMLAMVEVQDWIGRPFRSRTHDLARALAKSVAEACAAPANRAPLSHCQSEPANAATRFGNG